MKAIGSEVLGQGSVRIQHPPEEFIGVPADQPSDPRTEDRRRGDQVQSHVQVGHRPESQRRHREQQQGEQDPGAHEGEADHGRARMQDPPQALPPPRPRGRGLGDDHGGIDHRAHARRPVARLAVRTGRILVNAPTAVGALGGIYNNLTPTFSLGCGTWGGSSTTENVNYRQLLNIKTVSRRRTPPQWFRVPSNTFFNAGALDNLREALLLYYEGKSPEINDIPTFITTLELAI